jgi:hypothetical protein
MRVEDQAPPLVTGPRPPAYWPAELYVAVETVPTASYHWDDYVTTWDAAGDPYTWDDLTVPEWTDLTCDVEGLTIAVGSQATEARPDAGEATIALRNVDGAYSQWRSDGMAGSGRW